MKKTSLPILIILALAVGAVFAQTTEFTYQGSLQNSGAAATGNFDFEFLLYDASAGGNQIGSTITRNGVAVANGVFSVNLDFGSSFPGASRFLDIRVRQSGGGAFTALAPRQSVTSAPYSVKSLTADNAVNAANATNAVNATTSTNALQLGGVAAGQYLQTNGNGSGLTNLNAASIATGTLNNARLGQIPTANIADGAVTSPKIAGGQVVKSVNTLKDDVTLAAGANITITPAGNTLTIASTGGGNAILNQTTQQAGANFNISGNGTAGGTLSGNIVNATTQFNMNGFRVLSNAGSSNLFAGIGAGAANTGVSNAFFGTNAGQANATGSFNAFFGESAGQAHTTSDGNTFFGANAGQTNTTGGSNAFFGTLAGYSTTTAGNNAFFGRSAGQTNMTGSDNAFFGTNAGFGNTTGSNNTIIGNNANLASGNLSFATAIGARASVSASNSMVLGGIAGTNGATSNTSVGIGTTAPNARFHVRVNTGNVLIGDSGCGTQFNGIGFGASLTCNNYSMLGEGSNTFINRPTGGSILFREGNSDQVVIRPGGVLAIVALGGGGTATLCRNPNLDVSFCGSSLRYKKEIEPYRGGLDLLQRFRPVAFTWKDGGKRDVGFIAEEVAEIEPLLTFKNPKGEIEGVAYAQITTVLVNAVKEQQAQIEALKKQIDTLTKLVCLSNTQSKACREERE